MTHLNIKTKFRGTMIKKEEVKSNRSLLIFLCLSLQKYDDDNKRHVENELEKNKHCI